MVPAGTYRAAALEGRLGVTGTGADQVAVRFALLDMDGQQVTWYGYFTEKTEERTIESLRIAGWLGTDLSDLSDLSRNDTPEVYLVIEHENDPNGVERMRVRWVNAAGGIAMKNAMDPEQSRAFAARMRAKVQAFDAQRGKPVAPRPAAAPVASAPAKTALDF